MLFCNIIGEVNTEDYQLIQNINQSLSQFTSSPYIAELYNLLETLQNLCTPLIQTKQSLGPQVKIAPWYPVTNGDREMPITTASSAEASLPQDSCPDASSQSFLSNRLLASSTELQPVTDDLMWHLFNSQPSLQWGDPNIISQDPTANF